MYEIDPSRTDLVAEFRKNPGGPHSSELALVVNRLRVMPMADRHILVCTRRGRQWTLAKMPSERGAKLELYEDRGLPLMILSIKLRFNLAKAKPESYV